ncbi:MAG: hypothetical protein GW783_05165 [Deltaproteobacteria bacterium]|nr:hypothetical protein [Deltaproteobacteria bacterium]
MAIVYALHLLAAIVWVGGMFFAHLVLRPAAMELEPAQRLALWLRVFDRFFRWVWAAIVVLPLSGYALIGGLGGMGAVGWAVHVMQAAGWVMIALFLHLAFAPYRRMGAALAAGDLQGAAAQQATIRRIVTLNLTLGLTISALVAAGRWM